MKIGLVGYKGAGRSTVFQWLTGVRADPALGHTAQSAMAAVPDPRLEQLSQIFHSKKATPAALEIVDTPGLSRTHEGNAARLALIREAECLVVVLASYDGSEPATDLTTFSEDLLLADMEIVSGRIGRLEDALKKPIPRHEREALVHEEQTLKIVLKALEAGQFLRPEDMTEEQRKVTRPFRLMSEKRRMVIVNTAEDDSNPDWFLRTLPEGIAATAFPARLELELAEMSPQDRAEFQKEMGVEGTDRDTLIRRLMEASGQITFFTGNEREVRSWLLPRGATALDAAGAVHSDLARGFIRAEVISADDLIGAGSEREAKARHLVRQEPKDYAVKDEDVLLIRFSV
jgi:ribosome-binding ATPase YchF (GTP1/OBG family)